METRVRCLPGRAALFLALAWGLAGAAWAIPPNKEGKPLPDPRMDFSEPELLISTENLPPGLHVTSADPLGGIRGSVASAKGEHALRFESRVVDGLLRTRITGRDDYPLVELVEDGGHRPQLIVLGVPYRTYGERAFERALRSLSATAGALIRDLAYGIPGAAPGDELRRERRALQVPFQAIQQHVGVLPDVYVNDADFFANHERFVVKGLDSRLILTQNWMEHPEPLLSSKGTLTPITDAHDAGRVGDCFGRCGGGCGSWSDGPVSCSSSSWEVTYNDGYQECGWWSCTGPCGHTACGCRAHGCASHDWCVRNFCPGNPGCAFCWDLAVWAGITSVSCLFMPSTCWSYVDGTCSSNLYLCNPIVP